MWDDEALEGIKRDYVDGQMSIAAIARREGVSGRLVRKALVRSGVEIRGRTESLRLRAGQDFGPRPEAHWLEERYVTERLTLRQIGRLVARPSSTIGRWLREAGIELRRGSEAVKVQWENNEARREVCANSMRERMQGHVPWNKGLTKREHPSVMRLAESRMGDKNPIHRCPNAGEWLRPWWRSGKENAMYGKSPRSPVDIRFFNPSQGMVHLRSTWELATCRALLASCIPFLYEWRRFVLGDRTYVPDIYLPRTRVIWEIKGVWFNRRHRETLRRFVDRFPEFRLVVIDQKLYQTLFSPKTPQSPDAEVMLHRILCGHDPWTGEDLLSRWVEERIRAGFGELIRGANNGR